MSKQYNYTFSTRKGIKHKENWDDLVVIDEPDYNIFAVFDGVSQAKNGKEAAQHATIFIKENYKKYLNGKVDIKRLMYDLNQSLLHSKFKEPYSTYCLVYFDKIKKAYYYSWLGDSRLYQITNQFIEQMTDDDSFSEHIITKYLGRSDLNIGDFRQLMSNKDTSHLLLCTDGFYRVFESNRLKFFDSFQKRSLPNIKEKINSLIKGKNFDDSTFIFVK
jgi:serine/threonine protein phosphatase PrpC